MDLFQVIVKICPRVHSVIEQVQNMNGVVTYLRCCTPLATSLTEYRCMCSHNTWFALWTQQSAADARGVPTRCDNSCEHNICRITAVGWLVVLLYRVFLPYQFSNSESHCQRGRGVYKMASLLLSHHNPSAGLHCCSCTFFTSVHLGVYYVMTL